MFVERIATSGEVVRYASASRPWKLLALNNACLDANSKNTVAIHLAGLWETEGSPLENEV